MHAYIIKISIVVPLVFVGILGMAQEETIEWAADYQVQLADFQSPATEISEEVTAFSIQSGVTVDIGFQMNYVAFAFTKNFNPKVSCQLHKKSAVLVASDSLQALQLLGLTQYDFDLSELYARKIRKALFENKKSASKGDFFQPIFNRLIAERNAQSSRIYKDSDFGADTAVLEEAQAKVEAEIATLKDFCKSCKPPKRKKRKK